MINKSGIRDGVRLFSYRFSGFFSIVQKNNLVNFPKL